MAINPNGYQELVLRGYLGEAGKKGQAAITFHVEKTHLFKFLKKVGKNVFCTSIDYIKITFQHLNVIKTFYFI